MSGSREWPTRAIPVAISIAESWGRRGRARRIVGNEGRIVEVMEVVGVKVVVYYSSASGRHTIPF